MRALAGFLAVFVLSTAAMAEDRHALVIGNSGYAHGALPNPANDADLIAEHLRAVGFDVETRIDLDRAGMIGAIEAFAAELDDAHEDAVAVVYFAGHGVQANGRNFLIPLNANIASEADLLSEAVEADWALAKIADSNSRLRFVILDACRDNPLPDPGAIQAGTGLSSTNASLGTFIGYATAPGQVALDGDGDNSPYAQAIAEMIDEPGFPAETMFREVRNLVVDRTGGAQVPWDASSLFGRAFCFANCDTDERTVLSADELAWRFVAHLDTASAYDTFLDQFPASPFAEDARARLAELADAAVADAPSMLANPWDKVGRSEWALMRWPMLLRSMKGEATLAEFEAAAADGDGDAALLAAWTYRQGEDVEQDFDKATRYFQQSCDSGNLRGCDGLGSRYKNGEGGLPQSFEQAVELYRRACYGGVESSCMSLGNMYKTGRGVPESADEAFRLYAKSCDAGAPGGCHKLAQMHERGEATAQDFTQAATLYRQACDGGDERACGRYGLFLKQGRGVAQNRDEAVRYLRRAVDLGEDRIAADLLRELGEEL